MASRRTGSLISSYLPIFKTLAANNFRVSSIRTVISGAQFTEDKANVKVQFHDGTEEYPSIWLRDNCTCSSCFHKNARSRIINWSDFDVKVFPKEIKSSKDSIHIKWSDNHESTFLHDWLLERSFAKEKQEKYLREYYIPERILWDGPDFSKIAKNHQYHDAVTNDEKLYYFLNDLAVYGVALLKGAPISNEEFSKLAKRIGFIKETHYGKEWTVTHKPNTSNVAYLAGMLQVHTDLPYYYNNPGATFLHCIVQTESQGGENLLTDGFHVAEKMKKEYREYFDLLSSVLVNWSDYGTEDNVAFCKLYRTPVISLDADGQIYCVRYNVPQRDSIFTADIKKVTKWYHALKKFHDLLHEHAAKFKLVPGDILAFDNTRLTHGRLSYDDTEGNRRYLIGMYIDWDEIYSKIRILKKVYNK